MAANQQHKKIRLSGDNDCSVVFCAACNVLELNLGASTVRIPPEALHALSAILHSARMKLAQVQNTARANDHVHLVRVKRVH